MVTCFPGFTLTCTGTFRRCYCRHLLLVAVPMVQIGDLPRRIPPPVRRSFLPPASVPLDRWSLSSVILYYSFTHFLLVLLISIHFWVCEKGGGATTRMKAGTCCAGMIGRPVEYGDVALSCIRQVTLCALRGHVWTSHTTIRIVKLSQNGTCGDART